MGQQKEMPAPRGASVDRYWSHTIRGVRCQSVDFRHAFLKLRPDRIREVAALARLRARAYTHTYILRVRVHGLSWLPRAATQFFADS